MKKTKRDITLPFMVVVAVVVLCGSIGIYWQQKTHNAQRVQETADGIQAAFKTIQGQETALMQATISAIEHIENIKTAYLQRDRAALHQLSKGLLDELQQQHGITHFYFHQPDRINFLRIHQPDRYGDRIDRQTTQQAQESGQVTSGLELGPLGTLTLRVVKPWHDGARLIGFLELGKEIGQVIMPIQQQFPVDIYLLVAKDRLKQTEWSLGMKMLNRTADWDTFADSVLVHQTTTTLPPFLHHIEQALTGTGVRFWQNAPWDNDHFNVFRLPIQDRRGQEIAFMIVVQNVTAAIHQSQRIIAVGIVVAILGGIWVVVLFGKLLDRLEKRLTSAQTALQERDARLRLTQEYALDAIITIDANGLVEEFNPAAEILFGYAKETVLGRDIADFIIPPDLRQAHKEALLTHANPQEPWVHVKRKAELPALHADGHHIDTEAGLISITLAGKKHYTAFLRDITDRKQLLKSLEETLTVAESANRMKGEFLANMSHEIRTPMNTIIGMTDLILTIPLSPQEQKNNLEIVLQSAQSLLTLINNILDFSKMDLGMVALEQIAFDLSGQLESVCNTLAIKAHQKGLELSCDLSPALPSTLMGDPLRLRQILVNLVSNAIRFTEEGEVVIRVEPTVSEPSETAVWLHFSVSDTGIGIPADKMTHIFERFTQVDSSTTRQYGGSGLGLTISKHLVSLMDGEIGVESTIGHGSRFHFTIRFNRAQRTRSGTVAQEGEERQTEQTMPPLTGMRVLLADGHATGRTLVKDLLSADGMVVEEVADITALLQKRDAARENRQPFDLLILDHGLLRGDPGQPVAPDQQECGEEKILLLLPSHVSLETCATSAWLQGARSLRKPVFRFRLLKTIRHLLGLAPDDGHPLPDHPVAVRRGPPLNVLLVEDNLDNQKLAATILTQAGHTVAMANHGREALTRLQETPYDLVLMDLQMPEMDGLEATRQIRHSSPDRILNPQVPIIAVTVRMANDEEQHCLAMGMQGYLRKPYRSRDLLDIMDRVIRQHQRAAQPSASAQKKGVLRAVALDAVTLSAKGVEFIHQFPSYLEELERAIADRNGLQASKWVERMSDKARTIGAWQVPIQGMRLRSSTEQENWAEAKTALATLASHCEAARQAILEKELAG